MFRSRFVEISNGFLLVLVLAWMPEGVRSGAADQAGPADIERLGQRVSGYFTAVRSGQFDKARQFILPLSRSSSTRDRSRRSRITDFSIVEVTAGGRQSLRRRGGQAGGHGADNGGQVSDRKEIPLEEGVR